MLINTPSAGKKFPVFMQPESSLPCSQKPAIDPYPESFKSSPRPQTPFFKYILILFSHLHLVLPSDLFPLTFRLKFCVHLSCILNAGSMSPARYKYCNITHTVSSTHMHFACEHINASHFAHRCIVQSRYELWAPCRRAKQSKRVT
jgi:hypothetical protein